MIERYDWALLRKFAKYLDSKDVSESYIPRDFMQNQLDKGEITLETAKRLISEINVYAWERRLKMETSSHPPRITIITRPEGFIWEDSGLPF